MNWPGGQKVIGQGHTAVIKCADGVGMHVDATAYVSSSLHGVNFVKSSSLCMHCMQRRTTTVNTHQLALSSSSISIQVRERLNFEDIFRINSRIACFMPSR